MGYGETPREVGASKQAYGQWKVLSEKEVGGGDLAAGECVPPGGFICPGFRQGLISEQ